MLLQYSKYTSGNCGQNPISTTERLWPDTKAGCCVYSCICPFNILISRWPLYPALYTEQQIVLKITFAYQNLSAVLYSGIL